ncbi:MAG: hypothetical protein R3268_11430, partial [Acidiferrobacterales bacterium]|nr:hypothetical protein [Acidiferrobacterales bacterium]
FDSPFRYASEDGWVTLLSNLTISLASLESVLDIGTDVSVATAAASGCAQPRVKQLKTMLKG